MAIERYIGTFVSADDATKIIDMYTINDGCRMMKEAADKLERLTKKIRLLKEACGKETFSISGTDMEEMIGTYENNTLKFSSYLSDLSDSIIATTLRVVNRKQILLNEEAKRLDKKEILLQHHSNGTLSEANESIVQIDFAAGRGRDFEN